MKSQFVSRRGIFHTKLRIYSTLPDGLGGVKSAIKHSKREASDIEQNTQRRENLEGSQKVIFLTTLIRGCGAGHCEQSNHVCREIVCGYKFRFSIHVFRVIPTFYFYLGHCIL